MALLAAGLTLAGGAAIVVVARNRRGRHGF
jgi:hypothetical protein